jgi:hypothetical protein
VVCSMVPAASRTELQNVDLVTFRVHASARDSLFPYASMHDTVMARHAAMSGFPAVAATVKTILKGKAPWWMKVG